jgi:hypothetical protein
MFPKVNTFLMSCMVMSDPSLDSKIQDIFTTQNDTRSQQIGALFLNNTNPQKLQKLKEAIWQMMIKNACTVYGSNPQEAQPDERLRGLNYLISFAGTWNTSFDKFQGYNFKEYNNIKFFMNEFLSSKIKRLSNHNTIPTGYNREESLLLRVMAGLWVVTGKYQEFKGSAIFDGTTIQPSETIEDFLHTMRYPNTYE